MNLEQKTFKEMTEEEKAANKEYADFLEKFEEKTHKRRLFYT